MTPGDLTGIAAVSDPQISPSGEWVVYTLSTVDGDASNSTLQLVNTSFERPGVRTAPTEARTETEELRRPSTPLLPPGWQGSNPRWSPDSKSVAFIASHEGQRGLWVVTLERRQPRFLVPIQNTDFFITYAAEPFAGRRTQNHRLRFRQAQRTGGR